MVSIKGVFENQVSLVCTSDASFELRRADMCGEDVSFCLDAKKMGYEIWCDPRIRVGHEKTRVI